MSKMFASDNNSGVHPRIMDALIRANEGHALSYGDDEYTDRAKEIFKGIFGEDTEVFFVYNGTGANVLGISALVNSYNSVICPSSAHITVDECGAPENFCGVKLEVTDHSGGKIGIEHIGSKLHMLGFQHHSQPRAVSITQCTELGEVYTVEETRRICEFAHEHGLLVHMDGARLANAAASLGADLREMTRDAGVDVLSFGGTKNGMMFGEAVVFFNTSLCADFKYVRKQGMQLHSKMRYIAAQFEELLKDGLWLENARNANEMARLLAQKASKIDGVRVDHEVQTNAVFAVLQPKVIEEVQKKYFFFIWDEEKSEVRWVTSFDTTREDVESFIRELEAAVNTCNKTLE